MNKHVYNDYRFFCPTAARIDHAGHANLAMKEVDETAALHDAVVKVLDMTDASDTLVIVTGDHSMSMTVNGYATINRNVLGKINQLVTDIKISYIKN